MKLSRMFYLWGIFSLLLGLNVIRAYALPTNEVETVYFSDGTLEQEVGSSILLCQGGIYREGRQTRYRATSRTPCNDGRPHYTEIHCYVDSIPTTCPANICDSSLFECQ
jgi:uncharacterized protein DUF6289